MHNQLTKKEHNKKNYKKHSPYPVRLGAFKDLVLQDAFEEDRSGHFIIMKIIKKHYEERGLLKSA